MELPSGAAETIATALVGATAALIRKKYKAWGERQKKLEELERKADAERRKKEAHHREKVEQFVSSMADYFTPNGGTGRHLPDVLDRIERRQNQADETMTELSMQMREYQAIMWRLNSRHPPGSEVPIVVVGPDGGNLRCNPSYETLFGRVALGHSWEQCIHESIRAEYSRSFHRAIERGDDQWEWPGARLLRYPEGEEWIGDMEAELIRRPLTPEELEAGETVSPVVRIWVVCFPVVLPPSLSAPSLVT